MVRPILRANAALDLVLGWLLLSATWNGLYDALDLPKPSPALLAQVGGAVLWAFAYLLWKAPDDERLTRRVAAAAAFANALSAAIVVVWLIARPEVVDALGTTLLILAAVVLAALAAAQARIART